MTSFDRMRQIGQMRRIDPLLAMTPRPTSPDEQKSKDLGYTPGTLGAEEGRPSIGGVPGV